MCVQLKSKMSRSAKQLSKLNSGWRPAKEDTDKEMMTEEEKECLRKIGLKMDSSLVLGEEKRLFLLSPKFPSFF